jgi:protein SCO1/2
MSYSIQPDNASRRRAALWILLTLSVFGSLMLANFLRPPVINKAELASLGYTTLQEARQLSNLPEMIDHHGNPIGKALFRDHWTLVFFGFTHCPDVCPTTMTVMNRLAALMDERAPQVIFVSVDPDRDTQALISRYVEGFNPDFIGLTGKPEEVAKLATLFQTVYSREDPGEYYMVDHSTHIAVVNPSGQFTGMFRVPHQEEKMAKALRLLM